MEKNLNISGIGGWLGLLVIGLMVLGPIIGFGRLSNEFHNAVEQFPQLANSVQWQNYKQTSWLIFWASTALRFAAGYRLWKIHFPASVKFAILALWIAGPLANVLNVVSGIIIFGNYSGGEIIAEILSATISSVITAIIWTAYLKHSVRVNNTYKLSLSNSIHKPPAMR